MYSEINARYVFIQIVDENKVNIVLAAKSAVKNRASKAPSQLYKARD